MDQKIINLYDRFTHGGMSRRDFLDRLAELAGSAAAATALLPILQNDYAKAAIVPDDDPRLVAERVSYDSPKGKINGYLVRAQRRRASGPPSSSSTRTAGSIRTSRTWRGGCGRRLSRARARSALGERRHAARRGQGTRASHQDRARGHDRGSGGGHPVHEQASRNRPARSARSASASAAAWSTAWRRAAPISPPRSPYYGAQAPADKVPAIKAPLLLQYAETDENINKGIAGLRGGAEGEQQEVHDPHLSRHAARLQQRYRRRALQQGGGRSRLEPDARLLQRRTWRAPPKGA